MRVAGLGVVFCLLGCAPELEGRCKTFCENTRECYTPVQYERCVRECIVDLQDASGECLAAFDEVIDCVVAAPCDYNKGRPTYECEMLGRKFEEACESTF